MVTGKQARQKGALRVAHVGQEEEGGRTDLGEHWGSLRIKPGHNGLQLGDLGVGEEASEVEQALLLSRRGDERGGAGDAGERAEGGEEGGEAHLGGESKAVIWAAGVGKAGGSGEMGKLGRGGRSAALLIALETGS